MLGFLDEKSRHFQLQYKIPAKSFRRLPGILPSSIAMDVIDIEMEDTMLKHLSIYAALLALGTGSLNAQMAPQEAFLEKQEAVLQKVEVPGIGFDLVLAMPKSEAGATSYLGNAYDALVVHLIGDELVLSFDGVEKMLEALDSLQWPVCAFHVDGKDGKDSKTSKPVAVYLVPNGKRLAAREK